MRTSGRNRRIKSRFAAVAAITGGASALLTVTVGANSISIALCALGVCALWTLVMFRYRPTMGGYRRRLPSSIGPPVRTDASHVEEALSRADRRR